MSSAAKRVKQIFLDAIEQHTPDEWPAYLDRTVGDDPQLRQRVEILLQAHRNEQSLLDVPAIAASTLAQPATEGIGTQIGPYKLLQQIGEGGMGTVYMAEQSHPVQRKVALKVIKPGMDSSQVIARFEAERQALALMDHPNIAKVLDAATTAAGRPYFVMEMVKGVPITTFCDENHLPPKARLELFAQVCQAVQHAHQKGIIHRDLKPTNVLVTLYDNKPVPKVIDFGVAKATGGKLTERTMFTGFGQVVGTPEYMSPEQARLDSLDIDTRGDVYSLGVLLYELLTGTTPVDKKRLRGAAFDEMLRMIREEEPPKPSSRLSTSEGRASIAANRSMEPNKLSGLVRGELDWIVMKALEKDRNRRYESANGLAMDVHRYLNDEQVQAHPPSAAYRFRKFARRHRGWLTTSLAFLMLLITAVLALTIALVAVNRERQEKEAALGAEGKRRKQAREALDSLSSEMIEDWLSRQPVLLPDHSRFIEQSLRSYEEFASDTGTDEESRSGVVQAYSRVGSIRKQLGQWREAEAALVRCRDLSAQLVADFPSIPAHQRSLANAHLLLGIIYRDSGRPLEAEPALDNSQRTYHQLAAQFPGVPAYLHGAGVSLDQLGVTLKNLGRGKDAEVVYRRALVILQQVAMDVPTEPDYREHLAQAHHNLAMLLNSFSGRSATTSENPGRQREAQQGFEKAIEIYEHLVTERPGLPHLRDVLARSQDQLGSVLRDQQRYADSEKVFDQALITRRQLVSQYPVVPHYREGLAITLNNFGILLKNTDRTAEAETCYGESLAVHKRLAADFPIVSSHQNNVAGAMSNLARMLLAKKDFEGARKLLEEAIPYHQNALTSNPRHPAYRNFFRLNRWRMSETQLELKDHAAAAAAAQEFLQFATEPPRDSYTAACLFAGCIRLAIEDEKLTENQRQELTVTYGDSALAALRQAIEKGAKEANQATTDPRLDPLRSRSDVQKLLSDLEAKIPP